MYQIILVDDEGASLNFLRNYIQTYFPQFQIAGTFESGLDALEYCRKNMVDLIITDVKMPIMNGIDLARYVHEIHPDIHVIIISGYAEFEYAKGAIDANVDAYLLKPLSMSNMKAALSKAEFELSTRYANKRRELLKQLSEGKSVRSSLLAHYFESTACTVAAIRFGALSRQIQNTNPNKVMPVVWDIPESSILLEGRDNSECILIDTECKSLERDVFANMLPARIIPTVTMISDSSPCTFQQLPARIRELYALLNENVVIGKSVVLELKDCSKKQFARFSQSELSKIDYCIASANFALLKQIFQAWAASWEELSVPQLWVEKTVHQIADHFIAQFPVLQLQHLQIYNSVDELFRSAESLPELMEKISGMLISSAAKEVQPDRSPEQLYHQILDFMRENYAEPLTLQSVSNSLGISQTYLTKLFRKYGNTSFNKALTEYRLEKAKFFLQHNQSMRLNDIAILCGYENQSYFCKIFRQYTGMTPGQYVNMQRDGSEVEAQ